MVFESTHEVDLETKEKLGKYRNVQSISAPKRPLLNLTSSPVRHRATERTDVNYITTGYNFYTEPESKTSRGELKVLFYEPRPMAPEDVPERLHMVHLYVPTRIRGEGMGSILLETFKEYAKDQDIKRISFRVGDPRGVLKQWFSSRGFNKEHLYETKTEDGKSAIALGTKKSVEGLSGRPAFGAAFDFEGIPIDEALTE